MEQLQETYSMTALVLLEYAENFPQLEANSIFLKQKLLAHSESLLQS